MTDESKYELIGSPNGYAFITAVKTTGIFCKPTCTARKPKFENVEFVDSISAAIRRGYRACKRCKPLHINTLNEPINVFIDAIHKDPYFPTDKSCLDKLGLNKIEINHWFKSHHNIDFDNYYQTALINHAFADLKKENENLKYQSIFGDKNDCKQVIQINKIKSVIGDIYIAADDQGIILCEFIDRIRLLQEIKELVANHNCALVYGNNEHIAHAKKELNEYFNGNLIKFSVPTRLLGTPFQRSVWNQLKNADYGTTQSYKSQALALGDIKAIRAMATANGSNRIAIIVPCHRIVGSDGSMTGYAGGIDRKEWLITHERKHSGQTVQQTLSF